MDARSVGKRADGARNGEEATLDYPYEVGLYSRKVATTSADAQRWFDRGLNWCFGYHHEEAVVCFEKALETDPNCAMAHWGIAYAAGPNYNFPWELIGSRRQGRGSRPLA
jgi:hypothetical protein